MGSLFDDIPLAASLKGRAGNNLPRDESFEPESVRQRIVAATRDGYFRVSLDVNIDAVIVRMGGGSTPETCRTLHGKLEAAWGTGNVWLDPTTHERARFDDHAHDPEIEIDRSLAAIGLSWHARCALIEVGRIPD